MDADGPTVAAICGSLRDGSHTRTALRHALAGVEDAGGNGILLDLREYDLPPYDGGRDADAQGDGAAFTHRVGEADAILLGTPMYHGSCSGVLKNALDYCGFDEFEAKTVGLLAVSGGSFPITALDHLRSVCRALNAWVLPHQAAVPNSHRAFEDGEFTSDAAAERVHTLGTRVVQYATIEPDPSTFESGENVGAE